MKATIIGGGSFLWAFGVSRQFVDSEYLRDVHLTLMDIDSDAVELVASAARLYNETQGSPVAIEATTNLDRSLDGADFVMVCISTGGLEAMRHDIEIPKKYGIYHPVGDTVGPGGWSRTVRNLPVFAGIGERMAEHCPDAWMINVTNPLTPLTRLPYRDYGIKTIGMCTGVDEQAECLAKLIGHGPDSRRDYVVTGIDHGSWFTSLYSDGVDVLAKLKEMGYYRSDDQLPSEVMLDDAHVGVYGSRAVFAVWRELGYMPSINDRHAVENWPWFIVSDTGELPFGIKLTTIEDRIANKERRREALRRYVETKDRKHVGQAGHGDDPIVALIESLLGYRVLVHGGNYRNVGQIPQAPMDSVVETRCRFDAAGVHPMASPMPRLLQTIVLPQIYRQEAIIDIALKGSFDELVALMTTDPLCGRMEMGQVRRMVEEMLAANAQYIQNPRLLDFDGEGSSR